jgi:hypothetical protein
MPFIETTLRFINLPSACSDTIIALQHVEANRALRVLFEHPQRAGLPLQPPVAKRKTP